MNTFELSRNWFDWSFENPEKISPNHSALYFFIIEHCNRLGWKEKFGLPTTMTMDAIGIKNYKTYIKTFEDLVEWGFIKVIEKSKNQWSATVIALVKNTKAHTKALSKASLKHVLKQLPKQVQSSVSIDKPINQVTINQITNNNIETDCESEFLKFWELYNKKIDRHNCLNKFKRLTKTEIEQILKTLPDYIKAHSDLKYRKNPLTYLNGKCWNDDIKLIGTLNAPKDSKFVC